MMIMMIFLLPYCYPRRHEQRPNRQESLHPAALAFHRELLQADPMSTTVLTAAILMPYRAMII